MRVAIVTECFTPTWNGVTNSVSQSVRHLERRGHTVLVVAPGPGPEWHGSTPVARVPGVALPGYRSFPVGVPYGLARVIDRFEPDVVHLAAPVLLGEAAGRVCRRLGVPTVASYQTDLPGFLRSYHLGWAAPAVWAWLRRAHDHADLTLAPSSLAEWELRRHGIGPLARWGRGVDTDRWNPERRDTSRRRLLLGSGRSRLVGFSGRLAPEKRVGDLRYLRALPGVQVVVVGDGPARDRLERELPEARFLGFLQGDELARTVASLDVFVHTGPYETYCQAAQEALACGVPVVAPASGGLLDLVSHGHNGWLYPPGRPDLLRPAVATLAEDDALLIAMGRAAHDSVRDRTWAAVGDQLIGHYHSVGPQRRPLAVGRAA
jgi:phosphatidylinositol alpha 1,6-mannosyltransferase